MGENYSKEFIENVIAKNRYGRNAEAVTGIARAQYDSEGGLRNSAYERSVGDIQQEQQRINRAAERAFKGADFSNEGNSLRDSGDGLQNTDDCKQSDQTNGIPINTGEWGDITLYHVLPENVTGNPNVIFYMHGAGWVFGNFHTHEKLVRELAARTNSVVIFPEYSLSPEAKYPVAIEQCYAVLCALPKIAQRWKWNIRFDTLTVAGDSVGGNMATVMAIMSKQRGGPKIHKQLLYYPVTNAYFDTASYKEFATGYYLMREGMMWFWDQYTTKEKERNEITASPLRTTIEQLKGLPPAMIIIGEADVLRDEGEAYAKKLMVAGVDVTSVRINAIFVMLNALDQTNATRAAMNISTDWINMRNNKA